MTPSPLGPRSISRSLAIRLVCIATLLLAAAPGLVAQFPSAVNNDTRTPVPGSGHDFIHMLSETVCRTAR